MSTWICRQVLFAASFAGLTACSGITLPDLGGAGGASGEPPQTSVAVARGAVTVAGPRGYCIDRQASRAGGAQPFILLASCHVLGAAEGTPRPAQPGLLTASVGEAPPWVLAQADLAGALDGYFRSEDGRVALARDGQADSVELLGTHRRGAALDLEVVDRSPPMPAGTAPRYWRSLFLQNGHLVTVTVLSAEASPLDPAVGQATLEAFHGAIRAASAQSGDQDATQPPSENPLRLLRRLLPGN